MKVRNWLVAAAAVIVVAGGAFSFSGGKTETFVCRGRVQAVHKPESAEPSELVTVRLTRWPHYVHLWSKSYGEFSLTGDSADNFTELRRWGDNIAIMDFDNKPAGMFNAISGSLSIASAGRLYDLDCNASRPVVAD